MFDMVVATTRFFARRLRACKIARGNQQHRIAVHYFSVFIGKHGTVRIAVKCHAHIRLAGHNFLGDHFRM